MVDIGLKEEQYRQFLYGTTCKGVSMSSFGWIRKCRHCGYFCYGHPLDGPCPKCGAMHTLATGETWDSFIGKIERTYVGVWWKPSTWNDFKIELIYREKE